MVDPIDHPELAEAYKNRKVAKWQSFAIDYVLGPTIRRLSPDRVIPTQDLGKFLTELAMGTGDPLQGPDIQEGRIIPNKAMRRILSTKK